VYSLSSKTNSFDLFIEPKNSKSITSTLPSLPAESPPFSSAPAQKKICWTDLTNFAIIKITDNLGRNTWLKKKIPTTAKMKIHGRLINILTHSIILYVFSLITVVQARVFFNTHSSQQLPHSAGVEQSFSSNVLPKYEMLSNKN
jgi:hypothetical protein